MSKLSYTEKMKLPFRVLVAPTGQGAVYDPTHRLIVGDASKALVRFVQMDPARYVRWDRKKWVAGWPEWNQMPPWATLDSLEGSTLYWIRRRGMTDAEIAAIPRA